MSFSEVERYLEEQKEPVLFVKKKEEVIGYVRVQDLSSDKEAENNEIPFWQAHLIPLHFAYHIYCDISVSDVFKLLGEEIVIVKNKQDEVCGYLRREDILIELLRQDNHNIDLFRTILSSIPKGIFVVDKQGSIINYNDEGLRMIRCEKEKIHNRPAREIFGAEQIERVFATGETILNQLHIRPEMGILADYSPILSPEHEVKGVVIVVQDLPMLEEMAMELDYVKDLNKDLKAILSTIYDEILVVNHKGELLRFSDNNTLNFRQDDLENLVGKNLLELEDQGLFKPSVTRLVLERKRKVSVIQDMSNGRKVLAVGNPVFDEEGNIERIVIASRDITETTKLKSELKEMKKLSQQYKEELESLKSRHTLNRSVVYCSPKIDRIMREIEKIARFSSTVLLTGESGVGKEVFAKAIHQLGARVNQPFLKINCGAIPENLLESELFGYEKGAFTGADPRGKEGYFQKANGGVLFLDEIGEMPLSLQVKLLRVLQEREVIPVGSTQTIPVDVQIIAATNKNLEQKVEEGSFREDLFYRLNVIPIHIPPLRERPEDIPVLAYYFLQKLNEKYHRDIQLSPDALNLLEVYSWPGNVRELQNIIERAVVTTEEEMIHADHLNRFLQWKKASTKVRPIITNLIPLQEALEDVEEQLILLAMERYKTTTMAAKVLGISQSSVSRKYQKIVQKQASMHA
ncbi:sigma 54-interacting transcriptional regulator [Aneurinibacillus thermoaerophilus]|nr:MULTISPECIES: sigma 54-interacting transcriptional regulator [Aneurinibacillus]AMA74816.1 Fis family transcriptional regulator [Aneurinibacillus sp. XH2]MED0674192.1 sigma 54-interacting transcriptional regulator [Aneurinibacillus thermoaerophilus]MED0678755.1 sigma 54-interacting transcriptional regulator [Aneurinibacillus thermoaerophilus]MED0736745.1 sigma 54-interacting transcriptional regulator [Aneurinibacillus thermoaerophilus]MED0758283.1 sigma 54-interacting transcriptional regulat